MGPLHRSVAAVVTVIAVAIVPVLGLSSAADAHNYLVSSTPADGETLTSLPEQFQVTTNGSLLTLNGATDGFALQVKDSGGAYYGDGCITVEGATMGAEAALGSPGEYTLLWQVISEDGHTVSGEFGFVWAPTDSATESEGSSVAPVCGQATAEPTVSTPTPAEVTDPTASGTAVPLAAQPTASPADLLWLGGAIGAILLAAFVTFLILERRSKRS